MLLYRHLLPSVVLSLCLFPLGLASSAASAADVDFAKQIRPLLAKNCYACHGTDTKESGLALHEFDLAVREADSGNRAIVPKSPDESEILKRITSQDPSERMPPEGEGLTPAQSELIRRWIEQGAEYKAHWAFLPVTDPAIPVKPLDAPLAGEQNFASQNPIDAFVQASWREKGLATSGRAEPRALIRRLYFDLLGVPPTPSVVESFAANPTDAAYEAIVDELLADPRFGERMARDWLDVVRYAETNSFERDGPKPNAYHYRDYVIESFNEDKSYRQFIIEQLAGDEVESPTTETLTATGFYRLGIWDDEPADPLQARFDEFDDLVTTIGQGVMGLTLNCARCHDHKIDPIPQKDYYQLVAFLRDVTSYGQRGDERSNSQIDVSSDEVRQQSADYKERVKVIRRLRREIENEGIATMSDEDKTAAKSPDRDKVIASKLKDHLSAEKWNEYESLKQELDDVTKKLDRLQTDFRLGLARKEASPPDTHVLLRGSPQAEGDKVAPAYPELFQEVAPEIPKQPAGANSAGRRIVLAEWLTSDSNRLTGRVIVNRIWQHHFGRGIVRSANNFGQMGDPPTHPELLDFLVQELVRNDWRLKPLHRMMLLSETYRQSSIGMDSDVEKDPQNDLFARFNARRLSAEELRDSVLAVSGRIEYSKYGPSIYPDVSDDVKAGQSVPGKGWSKSSDKEQSRRSIYIHIKRSLVPPELSVFDFPETDVTCEARFLTTQAAQALNMLNGSFIQKHATLLANNVAGQGKPLADRLSQAIEAVYTRPANQTEIERGLRRIQILRDKFQLSESDAFREYCLVLLNSNEFLYLD
ncbi:PSD1 and planctomycete cytochrome C domain-containing protein [Pirellulaceae bacterium SH501]